MLLSDLVELVPLSKAEPSHPAEEAHFSCLYPPSPSFSHYPSESWRSRTAGANRSTSSAKSVNLILRSPNQTPDKPRWAQTSSSTAQAQIGGGILPNHALPGLSVAAHVSIEDNQENEGNPRRGTLQYPPLRTPKRVDKLNWCLGRRASFCS